MEPPSSTLKNFLFQSGLCTPADIRRCRSRVRRLAKDLPTFDSIWIDALQQSRKLTAYQASCLQSGNYEYLQVGPCLIGEKIGEDELGESYLAVKKGSKQKCLLKVLDIPHDEIQQKHDLLVEYIGSLKLIPIAELSVPQAIIHRRSRIYLVSRFTEGINLRELLVRRGRFPAEIVLEIARIVAATLATLESRRTLHGNINLESVQITPTGNLVLLDAGLKPILQPTISFHADSSQSPERFAGTAPELIGMGNPRSVKADIYALGCLCWHLLAGRPPFASGDSLTVLAKHRSSRVPDVRDRAPETPPRVAEMIAKCTAQNPEDRPATFQEIVNKLGKPQKSGVRKLHAFRTRFEKTISSDGTSHASSGWMKHTVMTVALLLCLFSVVIYSHQASRDRLKSWWTETLSQLRTQFDDSNSQSRAQQQPSESPGLGESNNSLASSPYAVVPEPSSAGVILLDGQKPYLWKNLVYDGKLVIRSESRLAIVIVPTNSRLAARSITFENVQFQPAEVVKNDLKEDIFQLESNTLRIHNCSFLFAEHHEPAKKTVSQNGPLNRHVLHWNNRGTNSRATFENVVFAGECHSLKIENVTDSISLTNCLKTGGGRLLSLAQPPPPGDSTKISVIGTTLRAATNLLYCVPSRATAGKITLVLNDCVIDLQKEQRSLVRFENLPPTEILDWIEVTGEGTLVPPNLIVADTNHPGKSTPTALPEAAISVEGILAATFRFRGNFDGAVSASELATFKAPIRTSSKPGIDPVKLPQIRSDRSTKTLAN